jgi:glycosyltransferase involved in cell wall biosynthesis
LDREPSWRQRGRPQPIDEAEDFPEQASRHRHLGQLERHVSTMSHAVMSWAALRYRLPSDCIEVIFGGLDFEPYSCMSAIESGATRKGIRDEFGIGESARVIGLVGRIVDRQKGQLGLIKSMPQIISAEQSAHLLIVGDGEDLEACRLLANRLNIGQRVTFTGNRGDMPEVMAALDILAVPSLWEEALGFVALEGAASGLPIVAFRSGGLPEAVLDGITGRIAEKGDWDALSALCCELLKQPDLAATMGARGRARAQSMSIESYVEQFISFHERLASRARSPGHR